MLTIDVPGFKRFQLQYLVLDFNGTLAEDGKLIEGVDRQFESLSQSLEIHVITADTFGRAQEQLQGLPCKLRILSAGGEDLAKASFIRQLGATHSAAIGNGRNDRLMIKEAALGIAVLQNEGAASETISNADIMCYSIIDALNFFTNPQRLIATLRS